MRNSRHIFLRKALVLTLLLLVQLKGIAQVYPVQTNVSTSGPYFNYLSYYADENHHLQAVVTLTDFNAGSVDCRLRMRIQGPGYELKTNPNIVVGAPFTLTPGVPNFINGIDLAPYFQASNLLIEPSGINIDALPEGFTTICVDVIRDGATQEVLSTNNCTGFFLQQFQPAQALLPMCGANISTDEIFHTFQWAPPIGYVPSIGAELNYTFSLYEWNDPNNFNIFETGQGLVYSTQTTTPLVQLSNYEVLFQEGMTYVWRIESQITSNGLPVDMIVNNGISAPCTFTYGEALGLEESLAQGLLINLEADGTGERKGNAYWTVIDSTPNEGLSTYGGYKISYRKKPTGSESFEYEWIEEDLINNTFSYKIFQLEPNTTYEVFVQGNAGSFISEPSNTAEFTTLEERVYACGEADMPYMPENYTPLETAMIGMSFEIGQFTLLVTEVEDLSTPGHFKGKGLVPIAFLGGASAKVRFDDLLVDDEFRVREGQVDVITDGLDNWLNEQYMQFIDPIYVDGTVDSIYVDTTAGTAWVVVDGVAQEFTFDPIDYPIIIHDENGLSFTIYPDGTIEAGSYFEYSNDQFGANITANDVATFEQDNNDAFGFDPKAHLEWHENYEIILLSDSTVYFVANKSMAENTAGTLKVIPPSGIAPSFTLDGVSLTDYSGGILTLPNNLSKGEYEVHVLNGTVKIGKLNLFVYAEKERNIVIVPMTNAPVNQGAIENAINSTLGEANIKFNIIVADQFNDAVFTTSNNIDLPEDVGLMNKYSQEMKDLRDAYKANSSSIDTTNAYYIFLVPGFSDAGTDGYMMRGRSLGFVKSGADPLTYAHELGHGMGALEHTWKNNGPNQGTTNNLMDYVVGANNLIKAQWKELRDVDVVPSIWDTEEDAMMLSLVVDENGRLIYNWDPNTIDENGDYVNIWPTTEFTGFYTPSGLGIKLDKSKLGQGLYFDAFTGAVDQFTYDGIQYKAFYVKNPSTQNKIFSGYMQLPSVWWPHVQSYYIDSLGWDTLEYQVERENLMWNDVKDALKGFPEDFFTQFSDVTTTDKIIGTREPEGNAASCYFHVVTFTFDNPQPIDTSSFKPNGWINEALYGVEKSLNTFVGSFNTVDSISYVVDSVFTPAQAIKYCDMVNMFSDTDSRWARWYLQKKTFDMGYWDVSELLLNHPDAVDAIHRIAVVYDTLGKYLISDYTEQFQDYPLAQRYFKLFEKIKGVGSTETQTEQLHAYADLLEDFRNTFESKVSKIHFELVESDEDALVDLINISFTNQELAGLAWEDRVEIIACLTKDWMWDGEEKVALRVLKTAPSNQATYILGGLFNSGTIISVNTWTVDWDNAFAALYDRVTGSENEDYIRVLYDLWVKSEYSNANYVDMAPYTEYKFHGYNYDNKPMVFNYKSEQFLGFYSSNYNISEIEDFESIEIQIENPSLLPGHPYAELYAYVSNSNPKYSYHPLQPVGVLDTDQDGEVNIPANVIPAFMLYAFDNINTNSNYTLAGEITLDIVTTLAGVGPVMKAFKAGISGVHALTRTRKILLANSIVEFTSGTASLILNYACDDNNATCEAWQNALFAIEVASLSGDVIYGAVARQKCKNILNSPAEMSKYDNLPQKAEITAAFKKMAGDISQYDRLYINALNGFSDDILSLANNQGLSIEDFKLLQQKRYDLSEMSALEMSKIAEIRDAIPLPDGNTILQKVIPQAHIQEYLNGTYNQVGNFVTTAKDAKHLTTFEDVFYGMRLNYSETAFNLSDGSFGVIRYKTPTPNATVPWLSNISDPAPHTGNGFTGGSNGKLGVPEWKTPYNTPAEGAELWEVTSDGTETLRAIFNADQKFIAVP